MGSNDLDPLDAPGDQSVTGAAEEPAAEEPSTEPDGPLLEDSVDPPSGAPVPAPVVPPKIEPVAQEPALAAPPEEIPGVRRSTRVRTKAKPADEVTMPGKSYPIVMAQLAEL